MNSGLYALAGASATATAAAWANRLLEPMTKVSKMYFGLSRLSPVVAAAARLPGAGPGRGRVPGLSGAGERDRRAAPRRTRRAGRRRARRTRRRARRPRPSGPPASGRACTDTARWTSRPSCCESTSTTSGRSRLSSTSLVNSSGAATSAVRPEPSSIRPSGRMLRRNAAWETPARASADCTADQTSVRSSVSGTGCGLLNRAICRAMRAGAGAPGRCWCGVRSPLAAQRGLGAASTRSVHRCGPAEETASRGAGRGGRPAERGGR